MRDSDFEADWSAPEEKQHTETQTETKWRTILKPSPHILAKVEAKKRHKQMYTPVITAFDKYVREAKTRWTKVSKAIRKLKAPRTQFHVVHEELFGDLVEDMDTWLKEMTYQELMELHCKLANDLNARSSSA